MIASLRRPLFAIVALLVVSQAALAQYGGGRWQPPRDWNPATARDVALDGKMADVQGNALQVLDGTGHPYIIYLQAGFSKVGVTGMAKSDYLKPGMMVSFTAELPQEKDKKGVEVDQPLTDLAIITPSETNKPGTFSEDRDNTESNKHFVRGLLKSYKDGKLVVNAGGKMVTATVLPAADIKLESADLGVVRQGDEIKVAGKQIRGFKSEGNKIEPGMILGQTVDIKLQEPLSAALFKKKPGGK